MRAHIKKWHPDKNGGSAEATEKFKEISEAYAILSNPKRKQRYDMFGDTGEDGDDIGDFFGEMFGGMGGGMEFSMGGGSFEDLDDFMEMMANDNIKQFKSMFRDLGKGYRMGGKAGGRARGKKAAKGADMMGDMMAMMMMGEMMSMGGVEVEMMGKSKKAKQKKQDDSWETDSQEEVKNGKSKVVEEDGDDDWEDCD